LPHAFVKRVKTELLTPQKRGDFELLGYYKARSYALAFICLKNRRFIISIREKNGLFLIKPDKSTRPSDLNLTKESVVLFCDNFCEGAVFSNTKIKKSKKKSDRLLEPDFFCENRDFFANGGAIEIGFGSGRHLLHRAKEEKTKKFVGVEIYKPSIEQVLRRAELEEVENLYVVDTDARVLMESLPPASIDEIFVHFPVPWPDSPTRRVISDRFLEACSRVLRPGGFLELRCDDRGYFEYSLQKALNIQEMELVVKKNSDAKIVSKYEERWLRQGKDIFEMRLYPKISHTKEAEKVDFSFGETKISYENAKKLPVNAFFREHILINFEEILAYDENNFAIKVSFGVAGTIERRFIQVEGMRPHYFPTPPLCTQSSFAAHNIIKEYLNGKNS